MAHSTALVTGGATGIGAAITCRLLADGLNVYVAQRTEAEVAAGKDFFRHSARVRLGAHDLSDAKECARAVEACAAHFGALDILVNNAGVTGAGAVDALGNFSDRRIDQVIDVNLKAPLRLVREALPYLSRNEGVVVNIGSIAGLQAQTNAAAYVSSKAGMDGLTRALAYDLASLRVRVVCIAPGDVETVSSRAAEFAAERAVSWAKRTPWPRPIRPADVAAAVAWVISGEAAAVTGSTIYVDGGLAAY
ncbi:3-oxoacyl-[acyl-carrier protein] reductase/dehydrogenase/reductase SDR family protein 4 [Kribbella jejuensis]|uniref:3-oxoacyl-[acyl-carrier protein] reductase/dehydrogenase/reductase SDR family protein 4 n=1 Tax=Kribbella jejuensis TaxID=236068 RepID=A0A542ERS8_9ACTN|nr:3-oxoacyl-[acyl-carrier protein] reductase/dehydrogenase/reductase SDR family protein 4 [Kribbella jejuensis]